MKLCLWIAITHIQSNWTTTLRKQCGNWTEYRKPEAPYTKAWCCIDILMALLILILTPIQIFKLMLQLTMAMLILIFSSCNNGVPFRVDRGTPDVLKFLWKLNVDGGIFFSVVPRRLVSYLKSNSLVGISGQRAGIPGLSRWHSSMIWQQKSGSNDRRQGQSVVEATFRSLRGFQR